MRLIRTATAIAVAGSLFALGSSQAAGPACNILTDDKGDAQFLGEAPNDPNLDIVSGDVASNSKTVTAVLRLASFADNDPQAPLGRGYYVLFTATGATAPIYFNMQITPDLKRFAWGTREVLATGNGSYVKKGDATGVIDAAKGEVRISVPVAELTAVTKIKKGDKLKDVIASTTAVLGTSATGGLVATVDEAAAASAYVVDSPSCVKPGV